MTERAEKRELRIQAYARETALCIDVPLAAIEERICEELESCEQEARDALLRLLEVVKDHRKTVEHFTKDRAA
jgi:1,2-phenylacetyl-CoA epoxidase catalytic subunit